MLILLITLFCLKKLHTFLKRRSSTKMLVGIVALTGVCCPTMGFAQYYVVGQDPPSVKWRQMETENLLLIYPDYYEMQMQSFRNYCDTFAFFNRQEMDMPITKKQTKIPILFHTLGCLSNGFSAWAPKRIEMWNCPPQNSYSQQWKQQLLLHEYRHELQMEALNQKGVGVLTSIFGEHVVGMIAGLFVPMWYLEGDATWAETILSRAGRGRQTSFLAPQRAVLLGGGEQYSYNKAVFGSYKDMIPSEYVLGYSLVAYDRMSKTNYWKNGYESIASKFWTLTPMYKNNYEAHYNSAMSFWKEEWERSLLPVSLTSKLLNMKQDEYSNYSVVGSASDNILAFKKSVDSYSTIIAIDTLGNETTVTHAINVYDNYFAHRGDLIAWVEMVPDRRWNIIHNNVVLYNIRTAERREIKESRNFFSPTFSQTGKIAVLEVSDTLQYYISIFDTNLKKSATLKLPQGNQYSYPAWNKNEDVIYLVVIDSNNETYIASVDVVSAEISAITKPENKNITRLQTYDHILYYICDGSTATQLYSLNLETMETTPHNASSFAIESYVVTNDSVVYAQCTKDGYYIYKDVLHSLANVAERGSLIPPIVRELIPPVFEIDTTYPSEEYDTWKHLFNFHSWLPISLKPESREIDLGVSVFSQNLMSTSVMSAGVEWNNNEQKSNVFVDYEFSKYYPIFNLSSSYGGRELHYGNNAEYTLLYSQLQTSLMATLPFSFYSRNHFYYLEASSQYSFSSYFERDKDIDIPSMHYGAVSASFVHHLEKPLQYIYHPWLQSVSVSFASSLWEKPSSKLFAVASNLYFPSPIPTHSIRAYLGYQASMKTQRIGFSGLIKSARGFRYLNTTNIKTSLQLNYTLPIAYPDYGFKWGFYCKRVYANVFFDMMRLQDVGKQYSLGLELNVNCNVFLISSPLNVGVRTSYLPTEKSFVYDLLFTIDI